MITRREFIKGMGALALLPLIPAIPKPRTRPKWDGIINVEVGMYLNGEWIPPGKYQAKWDNTGVMTIPHVEDGERTDYKVRYTVTQDGTEAEIVEE